jgi:hypothetical protein
MLVLGAQEEQSMAGMPREAVNPAGEGSVSASRFVERIQLEFSRTEKKVPLSSPENF